MHIKNWLPKNWLGPAVLLGLAAFPFVLALVTGKPLNDGDPKFWQGMLIQVFILAVYAISYDVLMGYTGILSFGHAMFFGAGAYATAILLKHAGWGLEAVFLAVLGVALLQSLLIGVVSLRVKGVYFAMVTLAFAQMFFILFEASDFRQWTGAEDGLPGVPVPAWMSPTDERTRFYFLTLAFVTLVYLVTRQIMRSPMGKVFVAIRENEGRAQMIGYNTFIYKLAAMMLAGVLAALAGGLNAIWNLNANPSMASVTVTVNALLMVIIGGAGTLVGPMLGAVFLQLVGYWLNTTFGPIWPLIFGLMFIVIVLFFPYGLVGTWQLRGREAVAVWRARLEKLLRSG